MPSVIYEKSSGEFRDIIMTSKTMSEALIRCGLRPVGSNRMTLLSRALNDAVDVSHLSDTPKQKTKKRSLDEILVRNSPNVSTYHMKNRLLAAGVLENRCSICGQEPVWNGKPLTLHIDHINGDRSDNRLENLRIVCPHCDSQLPTYKGKNRYHKPQVDKTKCSCGNKKCPRAEHCRVCANKLMVRETKIEWPSYNDLVDMIDRMPMVQVAKKLGVSNNAVKKHMRNHRDCSSTGSSNGL